MYLKKITVQVKIVILFGGIENGKNWSIVIIFYIFHLVRQQCDSDDIITIRGCSRLAIVLVIKLAIVLIQ